MLLPPADWCPAFAVWTTQGEALKDTMSNLSTRRQTLMNKMRDKLKAALNSDAPVRDPTTWTIIRHDGPNHLVL